MPIRPENRLRYPKNWPDLRAAVLQRAGFRCEGSPMFPDCRAPGASWRNNETGEYTLREAVAERWRLDGQRSTLIVLTIGHLDHIPEHCDLSNLRAWCQRCHLNYDAKHHAQTAYMTRRAGRAMELFESSKTKTRPC